MPTEPLLVVNPRSGGGKTGAVFASMKKTIEDALGPVHVAMTERAGHGIELAREGAKAGHALVVAVGGDGTFNEVVNGVLTAAGEKPCAIRVGIIAQGTGGDFCRTLGIEHRLDRYLAALASGHERAIDVGKLTCKDPDGSARERYFVNILSAGMGGLVDRYVAEASRAFGGKAAYFGASFRALLDSKLGRVRAKLTTDGEVTERVLSAYMIAICNGRYFGSGMKVAPMAEIDDGIFEIVSLGAPSKLAFALSSRKIYDGSHLSSPGAVHLRAQKVELSLENDDAKDVFLLDLDGEPLGPLPIQVEILPGALTLRA